MTTAAALPQAERERIHRLALALHAFTLTGVVPLLAAAAASTPGGSNPEMVAAVAALRAHPTTRAAMDGAVLDIQRTYEAGKTAWDAGREREAAAHFERARRAAVALYAELRRTVPAAAAILQTLAVRIGAAAAGGLGFGAGLGTLLLGAAVLYTLSPNSRRS